jgi:hypothetical protein
MKQLMPTLSIALFVGTLFINVSKDSSGRFRIIGKANALGKAYKAVLMVCYIDEAPVSSYVACEPGTSNDCTPTACTPF